MAETYQNLIVFLGGGMERTPALARAAALARQSDARIHICVLEYSTAIANLRRIEASVMRLAVDNHMRIRLDWLKAEAARLRATGLRVDYSAIWGKAADDIMVETVLERQPDLVLKDVRTALPLLRDFFTPLDWQLLRLCPTPLMLVNPGASDYDRIIAAVDPMEDGDIPQALNGQILRTAQALAQQSGSALNVVYAYPHLAVPDPAPGAVETPYEKVHREARASHHDAFLRLLDRYAVPRAQGHFLEGKESEIAISDFADRTKSDLVVMGTVYRSGMDRFVLGSTAERLLYRLHCDVLALKPAGFREQLLAAFRPEAGAAIRYPGDA